MMVDIFSRDGGPLACLIFEVSVQIFFPLKIELYVFLLLFYFLYESKIFLGLLSSHIHLRMGLSVSREKLLESWMELHCVSRLLWGECHLNSNELSIHGHGIYVYLCLIFSQ